MSYKGLSDTQLAAIWQIIGMQEKFISWGIRSINPLKTKRICFISGLSAYRAVNTLHFSYKNQSLSVL
jgi:hypothetical protein